MTCREKLAMEHPEYVDDEYLGGCDGCPYTYDYLERPDFCHGTGGSADERCRRCWDREIPEEKKEPKFIYKHTETPIAKVSSIDISEDNLIAELEPNENCRYEENYCKDCDRSLYGKDHDCETNIQHGGHFVIPGAKCYSKRVNGKRVEKYPWEDDHDISEEQTSPMKRRLDMTRFKIFIGVNYGYPDKDVNEWLEKNPDAHVVDFRYQHTDSGSFSICIMYEKWED